MTKSIQLNTDDERYELLKDIQEIISLSVSDEDCNIFTEDQLIRLEKHFSIFSKLKSHKEFAAKEEEHQNKEYLELFKKAKMFVNHYLLTISMAVERGELSASVGMVYNINIPYCPNIDIPADEFLVLSRSLFDSDAARIANGGKYFANPSIGAVKVWVEKFTEAHNQKINKYNIRRGEVENIDKIRKDCDMLIVELNETVEKSSQQTEYLEECLEINTVSENLSNLDQLEDDCPAETPAVETKSKTGNDGINQLKFDLFFPE